MTQAQLPLSDTSGPILMVENPILKSKPAPEADVLADTALAFCQKKPRGKRILRDARRLEAAADAIAGFDKETSVYILSRGAFSLIDMLSAVLDVTGPAHLSLSTWTAANTDVSRALEFIHEGKVTGSRWLTDLTFTRRSPQLAARLRSTFGADAIRVGRVHAKFAIIKNAGWQVVVETSKNLNCNLRLENARITHDPELAAFLGSFLDEVWQKQDRSMCDERPYDIIRSLAGEM